MDSQKRRYLVALALTAGPILAAITAVVLGSASKSSVDTRQGAAVCPGDPLAGVHDPERLKILNPCTTFAGTVIQAPRLNASDGDVFFKAKPDPGYEQMLNSRNLKEGGVHLEIVPRDQPGCVPGVTVKGNAANLGTCSGANVLYPPLGAHISVRGAWVFDTWNNWNEIHPVWEVSIIRSSAPASPERHTFKAQLVGRGGLGRGSARAQFSLTEARLCWTFRAVDSAVAPTRAALTPRVSGWLVAIPLGPRYARHGCLTLSASRLKSLTTAPMSYDVSLFPRRHAKGALRGRLVPTSD